MNQKRSAHLSLLKKVIAFAKPFRKPLSIIFLCTFLVAIVEALNSWSLSKIFDIVQKHGTDKSYLMQAFLYVGIACVFVFLRILILDLKGHVQIKKLDVLMANYLNHESIAKFFSFSTGQHINEHSGVKQTIVNTGTASIQNQISMLTSQLFPAVTQFFVALGILFYANLIVGFIFLGIGIMFCIMMYYLNKMLVPGIRKIRDRKQLNSRLMSEVYRLVSFIKNESQEERALSQVSDAQQKHQDVFQETWIPVIRRLRVIRSSTAFTRYAAMLLVIYLLFEGKISAGTLFLCFTWSSTFVISLWEITDLHKTFLLDKINIERYFELLEIKSDISISENPIRLSTIEGTIEFKNVSFGYPRRVKSYEESEIDDLANSLVLNNVSFVVKPGEKVGIVGESGSGKSTLANLLRRDFDPKEGQILIDGNDLRFIDLKFYLRKVGSVEQEVVMLDRSIRENILFGLHSPAYVSDERLHELSKMTRIDGFFERLEHGFDTIVGEKGVKLSGGERQRIGIARALAKEPSILIFDEATSALDSMSESIVQQSIDEACKGKTSIVIAHRLSTVKNCDKILVFRHGLLVGQGTHEELLVSSEYYSELVKHQMMAA